MKNTNILIVVIAAVLISCSYRVNAQGCNARSCTLASDCYSDSQCNSNCQGNQCTTSTLNCTNTTKPYCYRPLIIGNPSCEDCTTDSHCVSKNSSLPYCTGAGGGNNRCVQCTSNTDCITKDDCGATCSATGACTPSGNPARNCTKYQYGNCIQSGGVMICSGECDPNANACNVLYAGKKNLCVANGTTGTYICQGCTDALCQSEGDCGATCNVTNGTCIPSGNPTLNCTNQSLVCNYQNRVCAECNNDTMCVLKSLNNGAACARPNGGGGGQTPRCVECTGGNSCVSNDHCNGNCQTGVCTGGTNCTAINRVCTGRVCAQCASNADCTNSSQPICNGGTCAQCGANADCSVYCGGQCNNNVCTGTICQPGFQCIGGGFGQCVGIYNGCPFTCPNASLPFCRTQPSYACVECTNDAQCITKTGACSATCTNNACSVGANITCNASSSKPVCNTATGTCVECETNNDCQNASLSRCDTTGINPSYTCKACITDGQCTNSSSCSGSTCTNFVCVTNGGCNCSANAVAKVCRNNQYCAECATAADCAAPRSTCTNFGKCVQCNADADCRSATNCNAVCSDDGLCTNPTSALDCTKATNNPSATCSTTEGTCIQCQNNNDCTGVAGKTYCNTNTQKCVACTANTQCRGTYCDSVCLNFSCVDGTTNCGANSQKCNVATGKCSQCYADGDCTTSPNLFCNSVGVCSACKQDTHCQADNKCNARCETSSGTCYLPGNKTLDCTATGAVCIVAAGSGACRECADDGDCSGSKPFCTGGRCSQCRPPVGTVTYLQDCRSNSNCNSTCVLNTTSNGYYCNAGGLACVNQTVCTISGGLCVECLANTDCTSSSKPYCLASAGKCVECSNNTQCDTGSTCGASCVGGTCERAAAATCASGTFCKAGSCVECLTSANCPNGQPCSNNGVCGVCSNTAACKSDSVCAGIQCIDSKCQQVNGSTILDCTAQSKKCDTANSRCVDCFTATDCPTSKPNCVTGTCTECTTDTQCRKNTNCNAVCSASYTCVNPVAAVDCSPQVCNTATATCAECSTTANCDSDSNCGRTCSNGQCGGIGNACTGSTSHCSNAKCVACTIAAHCGSGYTCTNNQCVVCTNNCPAPPSSSVPMYASLVTLLSLVVSLLVRSA